MPSPSPHVAHASPRASTGSPAAGEVLRPTLNKRHSSQSSHASKPATLSPASVSELHPLVKPRKTKIVLPRGHGSGRNLAKLGRQAQIQNAGGDSRKHVRQRSQEGHQGDTEIRLPGSLDEGKRLPLRRNLTSSQLPRNSSHTKLKKNLSHGQLTRLGSGKNLAALGSAASKGPPSPGLKARNKRTKSADKAELEKDLHAQEVELAVQQQQHREGPKRVGFIVSSSGEDDEEDTPQMEGSGMQDDEWTDQSASASPLSTRQNTANNSRRASVTLDNKPPDRTAFTDAAKVKHENIAQEDHAVSQQTSKGTEEDAVEDDEESDVDDDEDGDNEDDEESPSPPKTPPNADSGITAPPPSQQSPAEPKPIQKSLLHGAKEHPNPATRHLLSRSSQSPAPALVSNVSALDDVRSDRGARPSPTPSMISSRSNLGGETLVDQAQDELVSRFIPSASHPSMGSGGNTAFNTPKTSSLHTPENESVLAAQHRDKSATSLGPVSPGSTLSASSGVMTPKARSRNEQRLINEKIRADMEDAAALQPIIPPHVFDRRNESLKSYLSSTTLSDGRMGQASGAPGFNLGPDLFQGRFKAVNTELKVVQKFRDPIKESLSRLQQCKESKLNQLRAQKTSPQKQAGKVQISKSAVQLSRQTSKLSTSMSPPRSESPVKAATGGRKSSTQIARPSESRRGKVTFSQAPAETRQHERTEDGLGPDAIARQLWDGVFA